MRRNLSLAVERVNYICLRHPHRIFPKVFMRKIFRPLQNFKFNVFAGISYASNKDIAQYIKVKKNNPKNRNIAY